MARRGPEHHSWKGDAASLSAKHQWMHRHFPLAGRCEECDAEGPTEYSNPGHTYRRVRSEWRELCQACHRKQDDRVKHPTFRVRRRIYGDLSDPGYFDRVCRSMEAELEAQQRAYEGL